MTGTENLEIIQNLTDILKLNIEKSLNIVDLTKEKDKKVENYSLGMKQRLGIAMAIIKFPKFLILDEPTNGLDPEGMHEIRELLKSLPKQYGMTLLVSSHILSEMEQISKTLGIIKDGKLLYQGTLNSLMAQNNYLITTNNVDLTRNILNDDPYSSITSIDNRTVSFSLQNPDEIANIAKKLLRMMASYTPCIKRTNHLKTFFLI